MTTKDGFFVEWDALKNEINKLKHSVDFVEASSVFDDANAILIGDDTHSEGEERFILLGMSAKSRILCVVHCFRNTNSIRIISARKATSREQRQYEEFL